MPVDNPKKTLRRWTISECKRYLQTHSVPCWGCTKEELIDLVKKTQRTRSKTHPPPECDNTDTLLDAQTQDVSEDRRTVVSDGRSVVYPNPFSVKHWEEDLRNMPCVDSGRVVMYLLTKRGWTPTTTKDYHDKVDELRRDYHVHNIRWKRMDAEMVYIKGECLERTSRLPHFVWFLARSRGTIESGGCQCAGDDGGCSHVLALMFEVARHPVCPDPTCTPTHPPKATTPLRLVDINTRRKRRKAGRAAVITPRDYVAYEACCWKNPNEKQRQEEIERDLLELLRGTDAVLLQAFDIPSRKRLPPHSPELANYSSDTSDSDEEASLQRCK